ncbi:hypothetical protein [Nitrosomonas sp.]|uniref:hypothetical protein n=1 Tax=Nitrosomonas sp. TaxID=42353 RepID=UPI0025CD6D7D|nr:hypothetical protein [Nitrosomonas sp.]
MTDNLIFPAYAVCLAGCLIAQLREGGASICLSTDHDLLFTVHRWHANLRIPEIDEIKTIPHVPIRRKANRHYQARVFFWNGHDLKKKLDASKTIITVTAFTLHCHEASAEMMCWVRRISTSTG